MNQVIATWGSVIAVLLIALIGAVWRIGSKVGMISATIVDLEGRVARMEKHEDDHDAWHMSRGLI